MQLHTVSITLGIIIGIATGFAGGYFLFDQINAQNKVDVAAVRAEVAEQVRQELQEQFEEVQQMREQHVTAELVSIDSEQIVVQSLESNKTTHTFALTESTTFAALGTDTTLTEEPLAITDFAAGDVVTVRFDEPLATAKAAVSVIRME